MLFYPAGVGWWLQLLYRMVLAEQAHREVEAEAGCKFCGREPVCDVCGRCYDPNCNAGCIFCRTFTFPPQPETCGCCGQELPR